MPQKENQNILIGNNHWTNNLSDYLLKDILKENPLFYIKHFLNKIVQGDCSKVLKKLPNESIDLVITDPPYLVNYRSSDGRSCYANDDPKKANWLIPIFSELYRVLRNDSFCISFYGFIQADKFVATWKYVGFRVLEQLVWTKRYASSTRFVSRHHDSAYLLAKGNPPQPNMILSSVLNWEYSGNKYHPAQKPVMVIQPLIKAFSKIGDIILDPFLGSGTTAVASKLLVSFKSVYMA